MDGTGLSCREKTQTQKEIQRLITSSFYWGHLCNTYFPSAKHSSRTVEPLATWTISGNCTSIFGSYSPITPIKKETLNCLSQAKSQLSPTKGINYAIWNCNFKSGRSFIFPFIIIAWFILWLLKGFWDSREPWYLPSVFLWGVLSD